MIKILVASSYFLRFDQKQWRRAKPYPPLATLQVAASLRQAGHEVAVFDAMLAEPADYEALLASFRPQLVLLYEDTFNYLSKMCLGKMRQAACKMIASACRASARVIAAGPDASDAPEPYLTAGAEAVLIGEGLTTLEALLSRLVANPQIANASLLEGLHGLAGPAATPAGVAKGYRVMMSAQRPPLPAWDLIDVERYRSIWQQAHGFFSLNMAASRGCSFRCNWCAKPIWGNRYLQREATEIAAEMAYLKRSFNPDHIWFADDIFGLHVDWVREFAAAAQAIGGMVPFTIQTRADLVSTAMASALADAGCREAWIGAESGSQRILDAMNKGTTLEQVCTARARLAAQGIRVGFFIQLGYLDEQLEDIIATRHLIDRARPDDIGVSVSYPLPGTKFYEQVKAQLSAESRWQESNDLEMMFQGTYRTAFYRAVRNLLHDQVALEQPLALEDRDANLASKNLLQRRWSDLIADERWFRTDASSRAQTSGAPALLAGQHGA
jgi:anaerobic magnesium-protoporphyrin IX monomethyl ester cyclase